MKKSVLVLTMIAFALAGIVVGYIGCSLWGQNDQSGNTSDQQSPIASTATNSISNPVNPINASNTTETCTQGSQTFKPGGEDTTWSNIKLYLASSTDGKNFDEGTALVQGGGVPSLTRGADGTLLAVFQWFGADSGDAYGKVAMIKSTDDGATWSDPHMICLSDFPEIQAPYDPTIVALENGGYRLFFTTHKLGMNEIFYYASAISQDGLNFTYEGTAFNAGQSTVDSSVGRIGSTWYMIAPLAKQNGKALDAISSDGKTFTLSSSNRSSDVYWVGNLTYVNGAVRFYGSMSGGMGYSETKDGKTWTEPVRTNLNFGGDPAITTTKDGTYLIIYAEPKR